MTIPEQPFVEKEPVLPERELSVESIQQETRDLKARIAAAQREREKDVERRLTERESLIAEARSNSELLRAAEEMLEYFTAMKQLGELKKAGDLEKLKDIEDLVESLQKERLEIDRKIEAVEKVPEILGKVYDAAKKEDVKRAIEKEVEQTHKELDPQIEKLAETIKELSERKYGLWNQLGEQERTVSIARGRIKEVFDHAKKLLGNKSQLGHALDKIFRNEEDVNGMQLRLSETRKSLGWFSGKDKAAIDFILTRLTGFTDYSIAQAELANIKTGVEAAQTEVLKLAEQYKTIILRAWEAQNRINELTGNPHVGELPAVFDFQLKAFMEDFAEVKRWRDGKQVGKYDGWYEAIQNPRTRALSDTWESIIKKAGGLSLVYHNPKETKEQE